MRNTIIFLATGLLIVACNNSAKKEKEENGDQKEIKKTLEAYNNHLVKGEYAAMTDYIYPGIFQDFTKEEIIAGQQQSMHSPLFDVTITSITVDSVSAIIPHGADKYALAINRANNSFQFKSDATEELLDAYCKSLANSLGEENVKCNTADKNVDVTMQDVAFFIYSGKEKKWFTLGTANPEDVNKFIPEEVRNQLGMKREQGK
jgi:hypothetical protein